MKSKAPMTACILASIVALGSTGYGFASGTLFKTRQAVQAANDYSKKSFAEFDGLDEAFISGVDKSKKVVAIDMDSIPDNLTTEKSEGSAPLYVEGASGQQYAVTDADGNPVVAHINFVPTAENSTVINGRAYGTVEVPITFKQVLTALDWESEPSWVCFETLRYGEHGHSDFKYAVHSFLFLSAFCIFRFPI